MSDKIKGLKKLVDTSLLISMIENEEISEDGINLDMLYKQRDVAYESYNHSN